MILGVTTVTPFKQQDHRIEIATPIKFVFSKDCCTPSDTKKRKVVSIDGQSITDTNISSFCSQIFCCRDKKAKEKEKRGIELFRDYLIQNYGEVIGNAAPHMCGIDFDVMMETEQFLSLDVAIAIEEEAKKLTLDIQWKEDLSGLDYFYAQWQIDIKKNQTPKEQKEDRANSQQVVYERLKRDMTVVLPKDLPSKEFNKLVEDVYAELSAKGLTSDDDKGREAIVHYLNGKKGIFFSFTKAFIQYDEKIAFFLFEQKIKQLNLGEKGFAFFKHYLIAKFGKIATQLAIHKVFKDNEPKKMCPLQQALQIFELCKIIQKKEESLVNGLRAIRYYQIVINKEILSPVVEKKLKEKKENPHFFVIDGAKTVPFSREKLKSTIVSMKGFVEREFEVDQVLMVMDNILANKEPRLRKEEIRQYLVLAFKRLQIGFKQPPILKKLQEVDPNNEIGNFIRDKEIEDLPVQLLHKLYLVINPHNLSFSSKTLTSTTAVAKK